MGGGLEREAKEGSAGERGSCLSSHSCRADGGLVSPGSDHTAGGASWGKIFREWNSSNPVATLSWRVTYSRSLPQADLGNREEGGAGRSWHSGDQRSVWGLRCLREIPGKVFRRQLDT